MRARKSFAHDVSVCLSVCRLSVIPPPHVPAYARIGVSQPRPPTVVSAYRRMCPLRAMRRRIGVSAQGGFATLFAGTLQCGAIELLQKPHRYAAPKPQTLNTKP